MSRFLLAVLITGIATASFAKNDDSTGICYRRITALNNRSKMVSRYETVIVRQSSSIAKDIARAERFFGKGSSILVPDLMENTWIGASISDNKFDGTSHEDCSTLPKLRKRRS